MLSGFFPLIDENYSCLKTAEVIEDLLDVDVGGPYIIRNRRLTKGEFDAYLQEVDALKNEMDFEFIVHFHADLAHKMHALGVHLTADAIPIPEARALLGPKKLIGYSAHSVGEVQMARSQGADYVFLGPIFTTPKDQPRPPLGLDILKEACELPIPVYAIGGMGPQHITDIKLCGAQGFSALRAVYADQNISHNASKLQLLWR